ncbi:MAG: hypothetical protein U0L20_08145 [Ruminococcus sp.]|nr:hypothetical protein [Ruminococcus sp.]
MTGNYDEMELLAQEQTDDYDSENISDFYEQESRRYSRRLNEEEEARIR